MPPDVEWVDMNKQSNDGENKDGGGSGGCKEGGLTGKRATEKANKTSGTWESGGGGGGGGQNKAK